MQPFCFYKHKLLLPEYESKNLPVCCSYLTIRQAFWYVGLCGNKISLGNENKFMAYYYNMFSVFRHSSGSRGLFFSLTV